MKNMLIIDKEPTNIALLSKLTEALYFTPVVFLSWDERILSFPQEDVITIFTNTDLPGIRLDNIIEKYITIPDNEKKNAEPVLFIYSRKSSNANYLTSCIKIELPFTMERIYNLLEERIELDKFQKDALPYYHKLKSYEAFIKNYGI